MAIQKDANKSRSMYFPTYSPVNGRRVGILGYMDDYNRESPAVAVDSLLPFLRVIWILEKLLDLGGKPESIRVGNGHETINDKLKCFSEAMNILPQFIQPKESGRNAFFEWG